jgi:hypothetical protein
MFTQSLRPVRAGVSSSLVQKPRSLRSPFSKTLGRQQRLAPLGWKPSLGGARSLQPVRARVSGPGANISESPESFFKDFGDATEACTTRVKTKFGRPESSVQSQSLAFAGRSLRLWDPESPPRKSPTLGFLKSSLNHIAKGCKSARFDFTPAFHRATPLNSTET